MHSTTAAALDGVLRRSPLQPVFRHRAADRLRVLAYHGVDDPVRFDEQMAVVACTARPVGLDEVAAALRAGRRLPRGSVLVTFDDGRLSVLQAGVPSLRRHGVPAVAFVVPGVVGTDRCLWWDEVDRLLAQGASVPDAPLTETAQRLVRRMKTLPDLDRRAILARLRHQVPRPPRCRQLDEPDLRRLEDAGVSVQNHSWSHPLLDRCTDETVQREVVDAHTWLTGVLGRAPSGFAYPNGNWDPRVHRLLRRLGYAAGFLFDHRIGPAAPVDPLRVSRLRVDSTTSPDRFEMLLSGLHPAVHRLRGGS